MLRRLVLALLVLGLETGGATPRKVTEIVIRKKDHELTLLSGKTSSAGTASPSEVTATYAPRR